MKNPSEMISFGDSNWDLKKKGDRDWSGFIGMYEERQWPLEVHAGRTSIVFCDGHAESSAGSTSSANSTRTPPNARPWPVSGTATTSRISNNPHGPGDRALRGFGEIDRYPPHPTPTSTGWWSSRRPALDTSGIPA